MDLPIILWIQFSNNLESNQLRNQLSEHCKINFLSDTDIIEQKIAEFNPHLLCFDFDYPNFDSMATLRETKQKHPSLPILMMAEHNSEALVIWALRARVWDYFTKPVTATELVSRIEVLSKLLIKKVSSNREIALPEMSIPIQFRVSTNHSRQSTRPAIAYVENHFHEKVSLNSIAKHCGMEATRFSHAFKKENGHTFRDFLQSYRIKKAAQLLKYSDACVLEIACAVGFNDPSQFTRMFKRYVNTTPSVFRSENHSLPAKLDLRSIEHKDVKNCIQHA